VKPNRDFFLLATLGADLPGAISVTPTDDAAADHHHDGQEEVDHDHDGRSPLRFSLAGVQLKFSAVMEASGGLTIPADGIGGSWILKLPSARFEGVPENEFAMMELARKIGIDVPKVKLMPTADVEGLPSDAGKMEGRALAVQRFDRTAGGGRIHMEDFAQVFGMYGDDKYEKRSYANIAQVLSAEAGEEAAMDFARRVIFSVLIGNADMHLKNWSLLYLDGRKATLAPAYDYVSTVPYLPKDQLALGFGGSKEIGSITQDQIRRFAETAKLAVSPLWQLVLDTTEKTVEAWKSLEAKEFVPAAIRKATQTHIESVAASIK
jgi:serine/threonine-protein kinase HipA